MRVAHIASEVAPWSQSGGLADVVGALPGAIARTDAHTQVAVFAPLYRGVAERARATGATVVDAGPAPIDLPMLHREARWVCVRAADAPPVYMLDAPELYDRDGLYMDASHRDFEDNAVRFAALARAAFNSADRIMGGHVDVVHAHDWQAGLAPLWFRGRAATITTIHNLAHQGNFNKHTLPALGLDWSLFVDQGVEFYDQVSFLKAAINFSTAITTVSPTYAREITTRDHGAGMDGLLRVHAGKLFGIVNGIDTSAWDPATDPALPAHYDADDLSGKAACRDAVCEELSITAPEGLLVGVVSRLAEQKGIDLVAACLDGVVAAGGGAIVVGVGLPGLEQKLRDVAAAHPGRVAVHLAFDVSLARRVFAGCDALLVPSRFEPCGLTQLYGMRYGTVPIVRATGGLRDTVTDPGDDGLARGEGTGFAFEDATADALAGAITRAANMHHTPQVWRRIVAAGMATDVSWAGPAAEYLALYRRIAVL